MDGWMDRWMEGDGGILVSDGKCYNEAFFKLYEARCDERGEWKKMEERKGYFDCILVEEFVRRSLPFREYIRVYVIVFSNRFEKSVILKKLILKSLLGKIGYFYSLFFIREITF